MNDWENYFRSLSAEGVTQEAWKKEYEWFHSLLFPNPWGAQVSDPERILMRDRVASMEPYYDAMPVVFAFTFAAAHAEWAPQTSIHWTRRARAGLSSRIPKEATMGFTIKPQIEFVTSGRNQTENVTKLQFQSMKEVLRLFYFWTSAEVNPLDVIISNELLKARVELLAQLHMFVDSVGPAEMAKLALSSLPEYFPYRSEYSWQARVLTGSIKLLERVRHQWTLDPVLISDYRRLEERTRRLVLQSDRFILQNFSKLEALGFVSKKEYFLRESGMMRFENVLNSTTGDLDIYLTVAELALQPQSKEIDKPLASQTSANIYRILRRARKTQGMISLGMGHFQNSLMPLDTVAGYAVRFLQNEVARPSLPRAQALELLEDPLLADLGLNENQRLILEEARLNALIALLETEKVLGTFIKKLTGTENLSPADITLYSRALKNITPERKITEVTAQLESKILRRDISVGSRLTPSDWQKFGMRLLPILTEFDPGNMGLVEFLSDAFLRNSVGTWPSGMQALSYLRQTKVASPELKERLARRLSRPDHGDTVGEFEAFLVLFPESGPEIMTILNNHRAYLDRLIPMMKATVKLAMRLPEIISSIRDAREKNLPTGRIANFLYRGQFLDHWLNNKITSAIGQSCAELSANPASGEPHENKN